MVSEHPFPDDTDFTGPAFPPGPALLYVHAPDTGGILPGPGTVVTRVDTGRILEGGPLSADDARRERMLLRALLNHALFLLGPEEGEY